MAWMSGTVFQKTEKSKISGLKLQNGLGYFLERLYFCLRKIGNDFKNYKQYFRKAGKYSFYKLCKNINLMVCICWIHFSSKKYQMSTYF